MPFDDLEAWLLQTARTFHNRPRHRNCSGPSTRRDPSPAPATRPLRTSTGSSYRRIAATFRARVLVRHGSTPSVDRALAEVGVEVTDVTYLGDQPWPFPSSLMLGFIATAATTEIRLADAELEDARWLTRQQIAAGEVALPLTHSISFRLIEDWYNEGADIPLREQPGVRMWRLPTR